MGTATSPTKTQNSHQAAILRQFEVMPKMRRQGQARSRPARERRTNIIGEGASCWHNICVTWNDVRARPVLLVQHAALCRWLCSARRAARGLCWCHTDSLTRFLRPCFPEHERGDGPEHRTESRRASPEA